MYLLNCISYYIIYTEIMSSKSLVMLCFTIGSLVGGYGPMLFGVSTFSITSIVTGAIGGAIGAYVGYKLSDF